VQLLRGQLASHLQHHLQADQQISVKEISPEWFWLAKKSKGMPMLDQREVDTIHRGFADPTVTSRMTDFKASVVAFEVQKNFANKFFSNKVVVKGLIDDTSAKLLDNLYNLLFVFTKSKKDSEKTTRNIIKMSVKIGMLQRGDKFTKEEKDSLIMIQKTLRTVAMTLISFYQVDHTFDRSFVIKYLTELEALLKGLITRHLTEKSVGRVEQIFGVVKTPEFLDSIYVPGKNSEMRELMGQVVADLNNCLEAGIL